MPHIRERRLTVTAFRHGRRVVSGAHNGTLRLWDAGYLTVPVPELATKAETLCPLRRRKRVTLQLCDPHLEEQAQELTADQRRACGGDNDP